MYLQNSSSGQNLIRLKNNAINLLSLGLCSLLIFACTSNAKNTTIKPSTAISDFSIEKQISIAQQQLGALVEVARKKNKLPRSVEEDGSIMWARGNFDWTEGFFPGSLWYLYELTGDEKWKTDAIYFQEFNKDDRFKSNHDLGFIFNNSYGNGLRLTQNSGYEAMLIDAANTLMSRFDSSVGCTKSWNVDRGWQSKRDWQFPVIIDNMMNLELLFNVSDITGDKNYADAAISHANTTIENHFRENFSSYHVVDYDTITGEVRKKERAQGFSDESSWSRGQAWGLYGYTMCYRFTKDKKYLNQAMNIANFILSNPAIDKEDIPYWDYDAENIPDEPRDASAATITASALIELSTYTDTKYLQRAKEMMSTLSSPEYFAEVYNNNFLIKHCVGSIPHGSEIDKPLNYADYYYLESLVRLKRLNEI
ncbi:MAG: glycoside hydrolase family 88 protein [Cyclobacteriaceae bacterium]